MPFARKWLPLFAWTLALSSLPFLQLCAGRVVPLDSVVEGGSAGVQAVGNKSVGACYVPSCAAMPAVKQKVFWTDDAIYTM